MAKGLTAEEEAIVESCYFQPRYSGSASKKFWREVNHAANDRTLYDLACVLQNVEARVLDLVNDGVGIRARKLIIAKRVKKQRRSAR